MKNATTKRNAEVGDDPLDREIDFSKAKPNPFAAGYGRNRNVRIIAPDLVEIFPDSQSVNDALRAFADAARRAVPQKLSAKTAATRKKRG